MKTTYSLSSYYFGDKADKVLIELDITSSVDGHTPELYDMCGLSIAIDLQV